MRAAIRSLLPRYSECLVHRRHSFRSRRRGDGILLASQPQQPQQQATISTVSVATVELDGDPIDDAAAFQAHLAERIRPYYHQQQPVVVRGAVAHVPATQKWSQWEYWYQLLQHTGAEDDLRVQVELGGAYGTIDAQRLEIPFVEYLQYLQLFEARHGKKTGDFDDQKKTTVGIPNEELIYMAQNEISIPALYEDIFLPDFCGADNNGTSSCTDNTTTHNTNNSGRGLGLGRLYSRMLWLGPRGCVSPLHFDPLDNCLMHHVGRKRVLLFPPSSTKTTSGHTWHYAGHDGQQHNTSPIDPEILDATPMRGEDHERRDDDQTSDERIVAHQQKYPDFWDHAPTRYACVLEPGDLLYIPQQWWHHVRSLATAASVNVWWR